MKTNFIYLSVKRVMNNLMIPYHIRNIIIVNYTIKNQE